MGHHWLPLCLAFVICIALVNFSGEITPRGLKESGLLEAVFGLQAALTQGHGIGTGRSCHLTEQQCVLTSVKSSLVNIKPPFTPSHRYETTISPELGCSPDPPVALHIMALLPISTTATPQRDRQICLEPTLSAPTMEHSG